MTDIVERLRDGDLSILMQDGSIQYVNHVAADEIERLREALRQIAQCDFQAWAQNALDKNPDDQRQTLERIAQYDMQKIAMDALREGEQ
jgi:hypothetical protein